jgi:predicted RNA binding protein YcfA (HicA-like mRNA interferase family)
LICTFQQVLDILLSNGFIIQRHEGTSHRQLRGVVRGEVRVVTVAGKLSDEVAIGTLQSMIRQCGLNKKLFRK